MLRTKWVSKKHHEEQNKANKEKNRKLYKYLKYKTKPISVPFMIDKLFTFSK